MTKESDLTEEELVWLYSNNPEIEKKRKRKRIIAMLEMVAEHKCVYKDEDNKYCMVTGKFIPGCPKHIELCACGRVQHYRQPACWDKYIVRITGMDSEKHFCPSFPNECEECSFCRCRDPENRKWTQGPLDIKSF